MLEALLLVFLRHFTAFFAFSDWGWQLESFHVDGRLVAFWGVGDLLRANLELVLIQDAWCFYPRLGESQRHAVVR